jgi:hypothetical protein
MRVARLLLLLTLTAGLVLGQGISGGLSVTLNNGGTNSLLVTAYDMNAQPPARILADEVINSDASISVSISADAYGRGHLAWTAVTVDRDMGGCGHGDKGQLHDGDSVSVKADSTCPGQ